jgi:hypothetical protein
MENGSAGASPHPRMEDLGGEDVGMVFRFKICGWGEASAEPFHF